MTIPHGIPLFCCVGHGFSQKRQSKPNLTFYMKKAVLRIYRMVPNMPGLVDKLPTSRLPESIAVWGLGVVFRKAFNTSILLVWYLSIDAHFIFLRVEFEDALSMPVLKNRASRRKSLESQMFFRGRPLILFHTLPFSNSRVS
jgi:hypothetical protein